MNTEPQKPNDPERRQLPDGLPDEKYMVAFCEGNPGCATVVGRMAQYLALNPALFDSPKLLLVQLVDMNIRGSQVWVLYKDVFNGDLSKMIPAIQMRDPVMIERLNKISYHPREDLKKIPYHQLAVVSGWKP